MPTAASRGHFSRGLLLFCWLDVEPEFDHVAIPQFRQDDHPGGPKPIRK
jgi:hypothetical protein